MEHARASSVGTTECKRKTLKARAVLEHVVDVSQVPREVLSSVFGPQRFQARAAFKHVLALQTIAVQPTSESRKFRAVLEHDLCVLTCLRYVRFKRPKVRPKEHANTVCESWQLSVETSD